MVTAVPEVRHLALEPGDEFALLACDGIWDVLSNQEVLPARIPHVCHACLGSFHPDVAVCCWLCLPWPPAKSLGRLMR